HQLPVTRAQMKRRVAGRMAGRCNKANTGHHLVLALDWKDIFPNRNDGLNALRETSTRLRQPLDERGVGPPFVFGSRNDDLRIRKRWCVCPAQQPENVIRMKVRNQYRLDPPRINAGGLHVGKQLAGDKHRFWIEGLDLATASRIAQSELAVDVDHERGD